jgi:signal transduction histidine kinase
MTGGGERERIALVVHEVRSPTAALAAIVGALSEGELDRDSLRTLVRLSLAACESIERVLADAALGSLRLEELDVVDVVQGAVTSAELGGARVRSRFAPGLPVIVGDRVRLRQALDNLIENAVVAAGSGGEVEVGVSATANDVVVSVADRGDGIPVEDQERIFEPGVRLESHSGVRSTPAESGTASGAESGSGLGLAIVKAVAEAHGGSAGVESSPGNGATFTLTLPVDPPHPAGVASSS